VLFRSDLLIDYLLRKTRCLNPKDYTIPAVKNKTGEVKTPAHRRKYSKFNHAQKTAFAREWNDLSPGQQLEFLVDISDEQSAALNDTPMPSTNFLKPASTPAASSLEAFSSSSDDDSL